MKKISRKKALEKLNQPALIVKLFLPKQDDGDYSLVTKLTVKNGEVSALWGTTLWEGDVF